MDCNMSKTMKNKRGFTLIEVIVSLVVAGVLAAIFTAFMGTSLVRSADPVNLAQNGTYLNSIMEKMGADYKYQMTQAAINSLSPSQGLSNFISNVGAEGSSQTNYSTDTAHSYTVINNHKVSFSTTSPYTESTDPSGKILKVTISYNNLSATALFTE